MSVLTKLEVCLLIDVLDIFNVVCDWRLSVRGSGQCRYGGINTPSQNRVEGRTVEQFWGVRLEGVQSSHFLVMSWGMMFGHVISHHQQRWDPDYID